MLLVSLLVFSSTVSAKSKTQTENGNQNKNAAGIRKESKNTIDVLVAGDSLSYSSVSPLGLWNQYGITSYVCGQPGQMLSETYETLKLAFKTQKPRLVLFETNVLFRRLDKKNEKKDLMSKLYVREDSKGFKQKVTEYLGKYLKNEFGLSDHRDEALYKTWKRTAKEYTRKEQEMLKQMQAIIGKEKMKS